jgi:O-antigen ligase
MLSNQLLINSSYETKNKFNPTKLVKLTSWFALLMSFNNLIFFGINFSVIFFLYFYAFASKYYVLYSIKEKVHIYSILFGIGAIISVIDLNANGEDTLGRAMLVLPNFIYWTLLVIVFTNVSTKSNLLDEKNLVFISEKIFIGIIFSLVFYEFRTFLKAPFLIKDTPNSYAFGIVCFSAISTVYAYQKYGKIKMLIFITMVLLSMLFLERRAGFVLVFLSAFLAMNFSKISLKSIFSLLISGLFVFLLLKVSFIENIILSASPRIHESLYESKNISTQDQSYLTRVAMVEKGLAIFAENPLTGVGLNNFSNHTVNILGNFSGSELILQKELNNKSGHNSYIAMLAEGGALLLIPFLLLISFNLYHFVVNYRRRTVLENAYYWSFVAMVIHIYLISEMYNVFAWFLLAMVSAISLKYAKKVQKIYKKGIRTLQ